MFNQIRETDRSRKFRAQLATVAPEADFCSVIKDTERDEERGSHRPPTETGHRFCMRCQIVLSQ